MMELLILVLLSVQAYECAPLSSFSSPPPILPPYSFKLDEFESLSYNCLLIGVKYNCKSIKSTWPFPDFEYEIYTSATFDNCLANAEQYERSDLFFRIKNYIETNCHPKLKIKAGHHRSATYASSLFIGML